MATAARKSIKVYSNIEDNDWLELRVPQSQKAIVTEMGFQTDEPPATGEVTVKSRSAAISQGLVFPLLVRYERRVGNQVRIQGAKVMFRGNKLEDVVKSQLKGKKYNGHAIIGVKAIQQRVLTF